MGCTTFPPVQQDTDGTQIAALNGCFLSLLLTRLNLGSNGAGVCAVMGLPDG